MTEIPDDVKKAARDLEKEFWAQDVPSGTEKTVSYYIALGIMAERERCAMVFEEYLTKQTDRRIERMRKKGIK